MHQLVEVLKSQMGDAFHELIAQTGTNRKGHERRGESFLRTLETGIRLLDDLMVKAGKRTARKYPAMRLRALRYLWISLDLTELILRENG
jgi:alanyl-tRNA synthetase